MRTRPVLDTEDAAKIMNAAKAEAARNGWIVAIVVVDERGELLLLERMTGAPGMCSTIAHQKAQTATLFSVPTKDVAEMVKAYPAMGKLPNVMPLQGGVPLLVGEVCVGAVAASGVESHEDEQIAMAGAAALA